MKIGLFVATLLTLCLTSGAFGHSITQAKVDQIRPGYTTEAELIRLFGPPITRSTDIYRTTSLDWIRSVPPGPQTYLPVVGSFLGGFDTEVQQLSVQLRADGRVRSFTIYDLNGHVKWTTRTQAKGERGYSK